MTLLAFHVQSHQADLIFLQNSDRYVSDFDLQKHSHTTPGHPD